MQYLYKEAGSIMCAEFVNTDNQTCPLLKKRVEFTSTPHRDVRTREPREPDTAEDAGGQTDHSGQAFQGGLEGRGDSPPSPRLSRVP